MTRTSRSVALTDTGQRLTYTLEPVIADDLVWGRLRIVLESHAPDVPGLFLYFPNRAQISRAFRASVDVAREIVAKSPS